MKAKQVICIVAAIAFTGIYLAAGNRPVATVPKAMPALAQAQALQSRATKAHLHDARVDADAALERLARFTTAEKLDPQSLGEILFDVVALGRAHDIDAEEALRMAARRFRAQVDAREAAQRLHSVSEH